MSTHHHRQRPFPPSVPAEAGCLFTVAAGIHVFVSRESLHCFLVGWCTNKSYVIATSDLWPFNTWFFPAQLGPMSKRDQELHLREVHCGAICFRKKEGDMMLGMVVR